jgi:ubiquinone/menaquinone biosynthesis C-methylase UbiE
MDVACGTGIVAQVAMERWGDAGRVAGVDLCLPMLSAARAAAPGIDWREGNAWLCRFPAGTVNSSPTNRRQASRLKWLSRPEAGWQ